MKIQFYSDFFFRFIFHENKSQEKEEKETIVEQII